MKKFLLFVLLCVVVALTDPFCTFQNVEDKESVENTAKSRLIESTQIISMPCAVQAQNIEKPEKTDQTQLMAQKMQQELNEIECIEDRREWFLAYKDIIFKYIKWFDMPQTVFDAYTEEEITFICRTVETECYDQDFISKCNVASVIFNRIDQGGEFGDSVIDIITKDNQFAYSRESISESTILSIMYVYEIGDTTDGCVAFRSDKRPDTWHNWKYSFTDDAGHNFYK